MTRHLEALAFELSGSLSTMRWPVSRADKRYSHATRRADPAPARRKRLTAANIDHAPKSDELSMGDKVIAKLGAAHFDEPSSRDARRRIVAFFRKHLNCSNERPIR